MDKPKVNPVLSRKTMAAFPSKPGKIQECPLSPLLFKIFLKVFTSAVDEEHKTIKTGGENVVLLFFSYLYVWKT